MLKVQTSQIVYIHITYRIDLWTVSILITTLVVVVVVLSVPKALSSGSLIHNSLVPRLHPLSALWKLNVQRNFRRAERGWHWSLGTTLSTCSLEDPESILSWLELISYCFIRVH